MPTTSDKVRISELKCGCEQDTQNDALLEPSPRYGVEIYSIGQIKVDSNPF